MDGELAEADEATLAMRQSLVRAKRLVREASECLLEAAASASGSPNGRPDPNWTIEQSHQTA